MWNIVNTRPVKLRGLALQRAGCIMRCRTVGQGGITLNRRTLPSQCARCAMRPEAVCSRNDRRTLPLQSARSSVGPRSRRSPFNIGPLACQIATGRMNSCSCRRTGNG
jgi:hypothetical protein